ncbi:flagellar brake protein [Robbsia andropogonis]|uniref:flagellar brake protein n=1 Tax=Robbsia andropogonis TaxID=28092 RepID=UPI00209D976B|nr:flagellar brake protein [Robbsia andropogonis]MCP1119272.1 flagellar brake protein [Robbsia andropogonis]MCP1129112.1 flagellar brake protein [Robbsia andropogonis]
MTTDSVPGPDATDPSQDIGPDYEQRDPLQISMSLRTLMSRRDRMTVEFAERQYVAHVLAVDPRNGTFMFDYGTLEADNEALLKADELTFRSLPGALHTHFTTGAASKVRLDGRPAFEARFPETLFYVQRREYFRVPTPLADPFVAHGPAAAGGAFRLELQDLSLGGVALRTYEARFSGLEIGSVLHDVALELGHFGSLSVNLEIIAPRQATSETGEIRYVISCRFVERSALAERVLQRVIMQLETQRKALEENL